MKNYLKNYWQRIKNFYHLLNAIIANIYYGFPSRKLKVIGVTGTDGKTTTVHLIAHILKNAGYKTSFISSVYAVVGNKKYDTGFHVTTPNPWMIQSFLKQSLKNREKYFVLETTSHALDQYRVWGINYYIGVITNITHEHLDYHQTYENYVKTKTKLLLVSKIGLINKDDKSFTLVKKIIEESIPIKSNKIENYGLNARICQSFPHIPKFNQYNYSAAYTVAKILGLSDNSILKAMKTFLLPKGRLEIVYDKDFKVIIDFAHTPNAIESILSTIKENYLKKGGKIIHVFGSAGLRDNTKRPLMGKMSGKYSQIVILTEEDYRTENPIKICEQISLGLINQGFIFKKNKLIEQNDNKTYTIIINRQEAIDKAISLAQKNDIVIITGKGHEKSLCRGKKEYSWDEKETVRKGLKKSGLI